MKKALNAGVKASGGSEDDEVFVPAYLANAGSASYYYGKLEYEAETNLWIIKGDARLCQMAKRLFPGSQGRGRGTVKFHSNRRTVGDLNWLMLRYPLEIKDLNKWNEVYTDAVSYAVQRERINKYPLKAEPDKAIFRGDLMEFQKEGVGYLLQNRRALLADEMGLGKTVEALAFLSMSRSYPALLVVPPHLVTNWCREIDRFVRIPAEGDGNIEEKPVRVHVIQGLKPYKLPEAEIYIIHYLLLRGWKKELPDARFKAVVFDEVQELRHSHTEKYSAASLLSESCETVVGLSGTPIYNKGGEIWNVMNILEFQCLGDWESFTREWCYGYGSETVMAPRQLGDYLRREGLLLRRTKKNVLKELPPKRRIVHEIDSDNKIYRNMMQNVFERARAVEQVQDMLEKARLIREIVNVERQATGICKAAYVASFVKMLVDGGEKVLLFAYHHKVMDIYAEQLKDCGIVFVTGRENEKQKNAAVDRFMNGKTNICCISLRAASGLNLQKATCVVFGELDWSPAVHSQAEDRAHRVGQKDSVLCYYLVCSNGCDQDIQDALGLKVRQFNGLMGEKGETEEERMLAQTEATEHMKKIIDRLAQETE